MADVQISVGLGWEAGLYTPVVLTFAEIALYDLLDEVQALLPFIFYYGRDLSLCGHSPPYRYWVNTFDFFL